MTELLKALDVINQTFKRALRGYDPVEVDEFLDRVADSLQAYAERCVELERELERLKEQFAEAGSALNNRGKLPGVPKK